MWRSGFFSPRELKLVSIRSKIAAAVAGLVAVALKSRSSLSLHPSSKGPVTLKIRDDG